ncbi:MAG TPA: mandelate racemase/muconate lactonizing enzyme family protein [Candidatus Saccharimonadales bacterium]|nr:mandelate racemase/muconate lactonizing enzyme family protein [Candidatus Saccharimonadales bacterium]
MKITDVRTVLLTGPSTNDPYLRESRKRRSAAYIEIHTDTELVGVGETYAGYFFPEGVPAIVEFFKPILVGQSVDNIAELWNRMYHAGNFWARVGLGTIVLNGIEAALWDLRGKMYKLPVYELLGGRKHDALPAYATGGPSNYPLEKLAAKVDFYRSLGFRGFKVGAGSLEVRADGSIDSYIPMRPAEAADFEGRKVEFLRHHVGRDVNIMLDGHMGNNDQTWELGIAQAVMKAVEPYDLFFFEEPLHYTDPWSYAELCRTTNVPIAGGECLTAAYEWRVFAERDAFDIGQPDAAFTGGMLEFLRVASMLEARGRKIATHSWASGGGFMQNLHAGFAAANTVMLEIAPAFAGLHSEVIGDSFHMRDGMVLPPDGPGLGIVLTDAIKERYPFVPGSGEFNSVPGKILVD